MKRIYEAIHMEPYKAKRRRLDTPAQGANAYRCDTHGRDCPKACPTLKKWMLEIDKMLPTDTTGKPKGEVEYSC